MKRIDIAAIWNAVAYKENKPLRPRDYVYASEIGNGIYDRVMKMRAVPPTTPPNQRSLRKFLAGNVWEYVTEKVLLCTGAFRAAEIVCNTTPFEGLPDVHGRADFFVGGLVNKDEAMAKLNDADMPEYLYVVAEKLIDFMDGQEYDNAVFELKSCSTFAMDKLERSNKPLYNNAAQASYYRKATNQDSILCYICKDDARMKQFYIDEGFDDYLKNDLAQIAQFIGNDVEPPKEQLLKFNNELGKFEKNFFIEYSNYLTHYGFNNPDEYRNAISHIESWNRVLLRYTMAEYGYKDAKGIIPKITDKNKAVKADIIQNGYNFDTLIEARYKAGLDGNENEENG